MYLLGIVCCQHLYQSQIQCWVLIWMRWYGLIILISTLGFDLSVHLCWKPYIKVEFDIWYFQWYVPVRLFGTTDKHRQVDYSHFKTFMVLFSGCDDTEQFQNHRFSRKRFLPIFTQEKTHFDVLGIEPGQASTTCPISIDLVHSFMNMLKWII